MIELDIAVVGGGFSGCVVVAQLARHAPAGLSLGLFEPGELGRGAAYGTAHGEHLLNTRAEAMSLFPDDPDHFVRWLGGRAQPSEFVARRLYGEYVAQNATRALERARFTLVADRAARIYRAQDGRFVVESGSGTRFRASAIVLATGNLPPNDGFLPREIRLHPGYVADPWRFDYRRVGGHVLVVGSGLTALDALSALESCGHRGSVHVVSRRGRFPEAHADVAPYDVIPALDTRDARALLRSFRRHVADATRRGFDWRSVVDAVRPEGEAIWRRLPPSEQRRFERHLRGLWERRRHRAPQQVDAVRQRYAASRRLFVYSGTVAGMRSGVVTLALRDGSTAQLNADWIVNCTGLARGSAFARDPLLGEMLAAGSISVASSNMGLRVTNELAAIGESGATTQGLWIVGPLVRGSRFEATAVPELRVMAEQAAGEVLNALGGGRQSLAGSSG